MGYNNGKNHPKFIDLSGKRFGKLTVLEYVKTKEKLQFVWKWKCRCDCGNFTFTRTKEFTKSKPVQSCVSCGYKRTGNTNILPDNRSLRNRVYRVYKRGAQNRGYNFDLTFEEVMKLIQMDCHYCGSKPQEMEGEKNQSKTSIPFLRNGIDRKDNKLGYTNTNVIPCCKRCNLMKLDINYQDFISHIEKIHNHLKFNDYPEREYTTS